jgi:hypothetical protein
MFDTHERPIARPKQKLGIDQGAEQRVARCVIEPPKASRLRMCQAQPGHLEKFALDAPEHFVGPSSDGLWRHTLAPSLIARGNAKQSSNACTTGIPINLRLKR